MPTRGTKRSGGFREPPESSSKSELLNVREAARFLRVSETSIRRWSDSGKLKSYRVGEAKHRRFAVNDLQEYLERGEG